MFFLCLACLLNLDKAVIEYGFASDWMGCLSSGNIENCLARRTKYD